MPSRTRDSVNYGIFFDMSLVGGVKTAADLNKATKSIQASINKAQNSVDMYKAKLHALNKEYAKGAIDKRTYNQISTQIAAAEARRVSKLQREREAVLGLDRQEATLAANRRRRMAMTGGSTARIAGMAASGLSGIGMGGRAAGAARFLGGAVGMGAGATFMAGGFLGLSAIKESVSAYADLESQVQAMKSLFGEDIAIGLNSQFRALAKTTILTNRQLIENAKIWASYGLTTEGITDRLKRLGTVAGGNSEKFRALTIAFAQVNAQGKLMGQEKNQLINAGMNLKSVADAAGISMENFAQAMEDGEIKAEHLNQALINITSEGGMFADYLEKQAETINGKLTILAASWEEFLVALGSVEKGPVMSLVDGLILAADTLNQATDAWKRANGFAPGVPDPLVGQVGVVEAGDAVPSSSLRAVGKKAIVDLGGDKVEKAALEMGMSGVGSARGAYAEGFFTGPNAEKLQQQMFEADRAIKYDQQREVTEVREREKARAEARERREIAQVDRLFKHEVSIADYLMQYEATQSESLREKMQERFTKQLESMVDPYRGDASFVGPLRESEVQKNLREKTDQEIKTRRAQMDTLYELEVQKAKEKRELEFELLQEEFQARNDQITKQLAIEKRLAEGPANKDAMFTGGSVEEFMFLRRQAQVSEEARATKAAEDRAQEQRKQLADERRIADTDFKAWLSDLMTNQVLPQLNPQNN